MPSPPLKVSRPTSVVQSQGPTLAPHLSVVSHDAVPFREELFSAQRLDTPAQVSLALHRIGRHIAEATLGARGLPVQGGTYWPDLKFAANTPRVVSHGVAGQVGWLSLEPRPTAANGLAVVAPALIEVSQDKTNNRVTLSSNIACTYDVWFFPKPAASR